MGKKKAKSGSKKKAAPATKKKTSETAKKPSSGKRINWLDDKTQVPLIDQHARKLASFLDVLADGQVDEKEIKAQEKRVVGLMKEVEPQLNDKLHAKVTELLCELVAQNMMQVFYEMEQARPKTKFRG
jgi:hypothetical protein